MKRSATALLSALVILCGIQTSAGAMSLSGRSSSQASWFEDERGADHFDLAQYLRFSTRDYDSSDTIRVDGYGRANGDVQQGGGVDGRLYYLYFDKKGLPGKTSLRVGRQFFFVSAGSALIDGAKVETSPVGPVTLTLAAGRNVMFSTTGEFTRGGDLAAGAQLAVTAIPQGSLNLSYLVTYDQSDLATEKVGLAADKRFGKFGELYTQLRFDVLSEVWNEIEVGATTAIVPRLKLTAEYFRTIPTFEATSIYSVFAVNRYQEIAGKADFEISRKLSVEGEYRNESYGEGDTANVGELGLRFRPTDGSSVYASGIWRNGDGGKLAGFELSGDMAMAKKFTLAAGVQHDVYKRDLMTGNESASRVWLGGDVKLRKDVSVAARVEDNFNENWNNDVRARLALNVDF
ncbi:MAG TPA: hypothetical protein VI078_08820 [bacterium]